MGDSHVTADRGERDTGARRLRQAISYLGPGFFVTIGFIDPGNWATNVAAGSEFGYDLLWIVTLSTLTLILWQHMAAHLGIVTGRCLAEAVHDHVRPAPSALYGATAMAACVATAVAEVLGRSHEHAVPRQSAASSSRRWWSAAVWFEGYVRWRSW
jgi:manganese transport protein